MKQAVDNFDSTKRQAVSCVAADWSEQEARKRETGADDGGKRTHVNNVINGGGPDTWSALEQDTSVIKNCDATV